MSGRGSELASCDVDVREVERGLPYPLTDLGMTETPQHLAYNVQLFRPMTGWFMCGSDFEVACNIQRYSVYYSEQIAGVWCALHQPAFAAGSSGPDSARLTLLNG